MNDIDPNAYTLVVQMQNLDGHNLYVGRVLEFPDVEVFEENSSSAHDALIEVIQTLQMAANRNGKTLPKPIARVEAETAEDYSGRVTLRLPKSLHRKASILADAEDISLNQLLVSITAEAVGAKLATPSKPMLVHHLISAQTALSTGDMNGQKFLMVGTLGNSSQVRQ